MHVEYRRLFRLRVRHDWYAGGVLAAHDDFAAVPTESTARLLDDVGLRYRAEPDGVSVFGEIELKSDPPVLRRSLGAASWRFAFELRALNAGLVALTELPRFEPGRTLFAFDNLRADVADGRLRLGDAVAGAAVGAPIKLLTGSTFTHIFGAPVSRATLRVKDRFEATVATVEALPATPGAAMEDYRLDLSAIPRLVPGRYTIEDDQGASKRVYYDPDLERTRPFGVIEVYTHTKALTPDQTDRVPAGYRFASGDTLAPKVYDIDLAPIATTWQYVVVKKYTHNGVGLADLTIDGPIPFGAPALSDSRAVFRSNAAVRLSAARRGLKLKNSVRVLKDLPEPDLSHLPAKGATPASLVSDMFVYV